MESTKDTANYISYFLDMTKIPGYAPDYTKLVGAKKTVCLDPTKQFVTLIVPETDTTAKAPVYPGTYWYVEDIKVVITPTTTIDGTKYELVFKAVAQNAITGEQKELDMDYLLKGENPDKRGYDMNGNKLDKRLSAGDKWNIAKLGGIAVDGMTVDTNGAVDSTSVVIPPATSGSASIALPRNSTSANPSTGKNDSTYVDGEDTSVYTINKDTYVYLNGKDGPVAVRPMILMDLTKKNSAFLDECGNLIFFFVDKNNVTWVIDLYGAATAKGAAQLTTDNSVTNVGQFNTSVPYAAYSNINALCNASSKGGKAYMKLLSKTNKDGTFDLDEDDAWHSDRKPVTPEKPVEVKWSDFKGLFVHQFAMEGTYGLTYTLKDEKAKTEGFDRDFTAGYTIESGILHMNDTSSKVTVNGKDYYVTGNTMVYAFKGTKLYEEGKTSDEFVGYDMANSPAGIYRYYEFEQFGTKDDAYVLVVLYDGKVSYITVICDDVVPHADTKGTFYGIYCGYDERGSEAVVYFVNPEYNTMQGAALKVSSSVYFNLLRTHSVGDVLLFTVDKDGAVTNISDFGKDMEKVIDHNANYIVTESELVDKYGDKEVVKHVYNLYDAVYYYVSAEYIKRVDRDFLDTSDYVVVYPSSDGHTVVAIYATELVDSFKDGVPFDGNIDEYWDARG